MYAVFCVLLWSLCCLCNQTESLRETQRCEGETQGQPAKTGNSGGRLDVLSLSCPVHLSILTSTSRCHCPAWIAPNREQLLGDQAAPALSWHCDAASL